jgi:hypothetical protein
MRRALVLPCALLFAIGASICEAAPERLRRGVSLGLFSEDAGWSYAPMLDEIAKLGATDVQLVVPLYQEDVAATRVGYHPRYSPPLETVRRTVREARARGLQVMLFPIVRLVTTHGPNEWRGTLKPADPSAWFASYGDRLEELARLAAREHVAALAVGSELSTLDGDRAAWAVLVARVRAKYHGALVYSANWDHFEAVGLWSLVDHIGVCAYFPLVPLRGLPLPAVETVRDHWRLHQAKLAALSAREHRPILLTELGYRSQPDALAEPWDEGAQLPVDARALEAQRIGYAAFASAFSPPPAWLAGYYVWNWYGWGGTSSRGYTPRGKPAAAAVESLLRGL